MEQCITILPDAVASQIAAGESIERPASVAKELLENALDAGAGQIELEVRGAGQRLVRVSDTGSGMCRDDALLAFERHATSKLRQATDLACLRTLGFRGEALPSIAAVARVRLETAAADASEGTCVLVDGGVLRDVRSVGRAPGTTVEVRNLFGGLPGRRKFLKSAQTEQQHIHAVVTQAALAQPQVALRLRDGSRQLLDLPASVDLAARLQQLYGTAFSASLAPVEYRQGPVAVAGFAGRPQLHRARRSLQHLFVNQRPVRSPVLSAALRDAYRRFLADDRHPVAFLFVTIDPAYVDVNVHPTKQEVRFHRNDLVADTVRRGVHEALRGEAPRRRPYGPRAPLRRWAPLPEAAPASLSAGVRTRASREAPQNEASQPARPAALASRAAPAAATVVSRHPPQRAVGGNGTQAARARQCAAAPTDRSFSGRACDEAPASAHQPLLPGLRTDLPSLADLEPHGQFADVFILAAGAEGLYIIDQHVAHERILYETLQRRLQGGRIERQELLFPQTIELAPSTGAVAAAHLATLARLGFDVERFGGRSFLLRAVPALLAAADGAAVLADVLDELAAEGTAPSLVDLLDDVLAMMACRAAVKAQTSLTLDEQRALLRRLDRTATPHRCPHGRPIILTLETAVIKRWFQRG